MTETKELIVNALGTLARMFPEQRMGQIIYNYVCANCPNDDPFFIEDEKLLEILEKIIQEVDNKRKEREIKKIISENPNVIEEIYEMLKR